MACSHPEVVNQRRDELVEAHLDLVRQLAVRIARRLPPSFELDDLVQQGCLGLLQAAERYDPDKNSSFDAYARPRIKGAILDWIRRRHWRNSTLAPLDEALDCPTVEDVEGDIAAGQSAARMFAAVGRLPDRERFIVLRYYGRETTDEAIGPLLGLHGSRVGQLRRQALERLGRDLVHLRHAA